MFILHATLHSLVRFTPARTAAYWGRYTEHEGACVCLNRDGGAGMRREALNPYGQLYAGRHREELLALIDRADVIHCHDDAYPTRLTRDTKKALVYHAHIGDIPNKLFKTGRMKYWKPVRHACITNGYGRIFDKEEKRSGIRWGRLPDILDIDHPIMRPAYHERSSKKLGVVFTYSNDRKPGTRINAKAPAETRDLLRSVKGVDLRIVTGLSFEESMALKRSSLVVLDEVFSPYTHLSSLEGASVGACVLVNYDDYTVDDLCRAVGAPRESYPFVRVTPQTLAQKVEHFRDHPEEAEAIGRAARDWMDRWYHPKILLAKYLEFYGFSQPQNVATERAGSAAI